MNNLTKYDIASIGIKLLAIFIFMQSIGSVPAWVLGIFTTFAPNNSGFTHGYKAFAIIMPLLLLMLPIILWIFSNKIAQIIAKPGNNSLENNNQQNDWQAILFCAVGVFIFVITLPELIAWIYMLIAAIHASHEQLQSFNLFAENNGGWHRVATLIALLVKLSLSLILIFTAKSLSRMIYKLRNAGLE